MKNNDGFVVGLFFGAVMGILVGLLTGVIGERKSMNQFRRDAIDVGVAYYSVDKYGTLQFTWRTNAVEVRD